LYRYSEDKTDPKQSDGWKGILGVWLWPIQILLTFYLITQRKIRNEIVYITYVLLMLIAIFGIGFYLGYILQQNN